MSAYASLPGSFLPPFFSFGASSSNGSSSSSNSSSSLEKKEGTDQKSESESECNATSMSPNRPDLKHNNSQSLFNNSKICTAQSIDTGTPSEVAATLQCPPASAASTSRPSDIIIAIRSARVDPVALIKSLTSTGSNIARRTASFIARTPERGDSALASEKNTSKDGAGAEDEGDDVHAEKQGGSDRSSVISRPGLCYEDSDSDEEFSMYDYSDDFSSPNDDETTKDSGSHGIEEEQLPGTISDGDPSAIEFELSITFQGRKYNATRGFPTFVKLREDLLHELKNNDRRSRRTLNKSTPIDNADAVSAVKEVNVLENNINSSHESLSVPELPRVSPESLGHGGGSYALCGVARSGFALLQATAQHYCPEMERWMRHVIEAFPYSQSLSSFLWEPLSSSNASWETAGEEKQSMTGVGLGHAVKLGSSHDASTVPSLYKPPLHTRTKQKPNNFSKTLRYKTMGSVSSLNSIEEDDGNES